MQRSKLLVLEPSQTRPDSPAGIPFKLLADDTGGQISALEWTLGPWQSGPERHAHHFDEAFYVVAGELEMYLDGERHVLASRCMAWVPRETAHTFANAGPDPVTVLTIATPGGLEKFFAAQDGNPAAFPDVPELGVRRLGPRIRSERAPN